MWDKDIRAFLRILFRFPGMSKEHAELIDSIRDRISESFACFLKANGLESLCFDVLPSGLQGIHFYIQNEHSIKGPSECRIYLFGADDDAAEYIVEITLSGGEPSWRLIRFGDDASVLIGTAGKAWEPAGDEILRIETRNAEYDQEPAVSETEEITEKCADKAEVDFFRTEISRLFLSV